MGRSWLPESPSKAVVIVIHGFTEHSGRYEHVADALNARGVAVYALDLRGHGRSGGRRVWIESFDEYLDDAEHYIARVCEEHSGKPFFFLGHSMGGLIVALLAIERKMDAQGIILSAPAMKVGDNVFPLLRRLASLVSRIWPGLRLVRMGYGRLSRDPANVERFRCDPLVFHGRFPVRTGTEILAAGQRAQHGARRICSPLLVLQGTADGVVDPAGSRRFYVEASSSDKGLKLYEGAYHDLLGEPEKDQIIRDVADWIASRY